MKIVRGIVFYERKKGEFSKYSFFFKILSKKSVWSLFNFFFSEIFYLCYGIWSTSKERRTYIGRGNLAFLMPSLQETAEKLRKWCCNRHKREPKVTARLFPVEEKQTYLPAITVNMRNNVKARRTLRIPGCPPFCPNSGEHKVRDVVCETCQLRFHEECVTTLTKMEIGEITLPVCTYCQQQNL